MPQVLTDGLPNVRVMGEQTTPPPGTTPGENIKAFYKKAWFWGILLGVGALGAGSVYYYRRQRQLPAYF